MNKLELINNRYQVIDKLGENNNITAYVVADLWNQHEHVQLNIFQSNVSSSLIDYFSAEFIQFAHLSCKHIIRDLYFNRVTHINNRRMETSLFYFVSEYMDDTTMLTNVIAELSTSEVIDVFVDLCRAIHYLHVKGHIFGSLSLDNAFINNEKKIAMLPSLSMVRIGNYLNFESTRQGYFDDANMLQQKSKLSYKVELFDLGILLLQMVKGKELLEQPEKEVKGLLALESDHGTERAKLLRIVQKLMTNDTEKQFANAQDVIHFINKSFNRNESALYVHELEKLNVHTKLIGQEHILNTVLSTYDQLLKYESTERVILLNGETGTGKTRLLEELEFILKLKGTRVYTSYDLQSMHHDDDQMWLTILRKLMMDSKREVLEKHESYLTEIFPELQEKTNDVIIRPNVTNRMKYRYVNRVTNFIRETVKGKPAFFLIDNIHLANSYTIRMLATILSRAKYENAFIIFTYNEQSDLKNDRFIPFIKGIKERREAKTLTMNDLTVEETAEMIKGILAIPYTPIVFSERIYQSSNGNPLFIIETLKDLFNNDTIYIDPKTGDWHIELPQSGEYDSLRIPTSIEQVLLSQIGGLNDLSRQLLNVMSIYNLRVKLSFLLHNVTATEKDAKVILHELVEKDILTITIEGGEVYYSFQNRLLKDVIYEQMSYHEKRSHHLIVARVLDEQMNAKYLEHQIFHYEKAGVKEKVKLNSLQRALQLRAKGDVNGTIQKLDKALINASNNIERVAFLIEIGKHYLEIDNIGLAVEFLKRAKRFKEADAYDLFYVQIKINLAEIAINQSKLVKCDQYLMQVKERLKTYPCIESDLKVKRFEAVLMTFHGDMEKASELCTAIIAACQDDFPIIKGNAYRQLAYIYTYGKNKAYKAIDLYEKAIELHEMQGYKKGIIYSLNNIGVIYSDHFGGLEIALTYFQQMANVASEVGNIAGEVLGQMNIGVIHFDNGKISTAHSFFKKALKKAEAYPEFKKQSIFLYNNLTQACLSLNDYQQAYHYYSLSRHKIKQYKYVATELHHHYLSTSSLLATFGLYAEARTYDEKILDTKMDETNRVKVTTRLRLFMHYIRTENDAEQYEEYITDILSLSEKLPNKEHRITLILNLIEILWEKQDETHVQMLVPLIKKEMVQIDAPLKRVLLKYYYVLGITDNGSKWEKYLNKSLGYAKTVNCLKSIAKIMKQLGHQYFAIEEYFDAIHFYLESGNRYTHLIKQVPDRFQLSYANLHEYKIVINRIKQLKRYCLSEITKEEIPLKNELSVIETETSLGQLIAHWEEHILYENSAFINYIKDKYVEKVYAENVDPQHILTHLSSNTLKNVELIVEHLTTNTLATRAALFIDDSVRKYKPLVLINIDETEINETMITRIKETKEVVTLVEDRHTSQGALQHPFNQVRRALYIPILDNNDYSEDDGRKRDKPSNILGYLYLESDKILNNLSEQTMVENKPLFNMLALVTEKHLFKTAASIDKLTGTLTRKYLDDALHEAMKRKILYGEHFTMIMYDLDKFKRVNDRFGHQVGDDVLRRLSQVVMEYLQKGEQIGRYGGEEFILLLPKKTLDSAMQLAEEIRRRIESERFFNDETVVTISQGVVSSKQAETVAGLIRKADQALYEAKDAGRNKVLSWDNSYTENVQRMHHLDDIITGDVAQDARNMLAFVELLELMNTNITYEEKLNNFLSRTIEIADAQVGYLFSVTNGHVTEVCQRDSLAKEKLHHVSYNDEFLNAIIEQESGRFIVDWAGSGVKDSITGLLDWYARLAVPVKYKEETIGVIYLISSARNKEFTENDLNIVTVLGQIFTMILNQRTLLQESM